MKKASLILFFCVGLIGISMGGAWNGGGGANNLWSNGDNWSTGSPPAAGEDVFIDWGLTSAALPALIDSTVTGYGNTLRAGGGAPTTEYIEMTGGSLTLSGEMILGQGGGSTAYLDMSGGVLTANSLWTGAMTDSWGMGTGYATMTDGAMDLNYLYVNRDGSAAAVLGLDLKGGLIDSGSILIAGGGLMNIDSGAILRLPDIFTGTIDSYISSGALTGNGVVGDVVWNDNGDGTIDVAAIPEPATLLVLALGGLMIRRRRA